jgi:GDP-4-dehydro-6-deoxy-D-mannose reductase
MKTIFVTGASGFVGRHFRQLIEASKDWRIAAAPAEMDLRDTNSVERSLEALPGAPDAVLHLAAQSNVPQAFADPESTFDVNFLGSLRLLRALKKIHFNGRFLFVGSADAYGLVAEAQLPVGEDQPLKPRNPYAVSKAATESLIYQWSQTEGLNAAVVRPFNHIGPGQDERFAIAAFARQIVEISLGLCPARICVGDIDVGRDFSDVRDVVRAYLALISMEASGPVYNVGSGTESLLRDVLQRLLQIADVRAEILIDPQRMRLAEQRHMRADTGRLVADTGWQPLYSLDQTLIDILAHWKEKLVR